MFRYSHSTYPFSVVDVVVVDCHDFIVDVDNGQRRVHGNVYGVERCIRVLLGYLTDHKSIIWIFDRP